MTEDDIPVTEVQVLVTLRLSPSESDEVARARAEKTVRDLLEPVVEEDQVKALTPETFRYEGRHLRDFHGWAFIAALAELPPNHPVHDTFVETNGDTHVSVLYNGQEVPFSQVLRRLDGYFEDAVNERAKAILAERHEQVAAAMLEVSEFAKQKLEELFQ